MWDHQQLSIILLFLILSIASILPSFYHYHNRYHRIYTATMHVSFIQHLYVMHIHPRRQVIYIAKRKYLKQDGMHQDLPCWTTTRNLVSSAVGPWRLETSFWWSSPDRFSAFSILKRYVNDDECKDMQQYVGCNWGMTHNRNVHYLTWFWKTYAKCYIISCTSFINSDKWIN